MRGNVPLPVLFELSFEELDDRSDLPHLGWAVDRHFSFGVDIHRETFDGGENDLSKESMDLEFERFIGPSPVGGRFFET